MILRFAKLHRLLVTVALLIVSTVALQLIYVTHTHSAKCKACPTPQSTQSSRYTSQRIPAILHQSWRTRELQPFQKAWQRSWLKHHPHWTHLFWTDVDNRRLIENDFPWFLDVYDAMPTPIQRADCARYFYMLRYGGCYVDLDIESLKTLDPALQGMQVALAYMTDDTESELSIPNAFLASVPGHPFWMFVIKRILQNFASDTIAKDDAHRISGPIVLRQAMLEYQNTSSTGNLTILPPHTVYGVDYNWRGNSTMQHIFSACHAASNDFNATKCKAFFPDSYAITYWSGDITWMAEAKARQTIKEEGSGQRESVRTPAQRQDNAWLKWPSSSSNGRV